MTTSSLDQMRSSVLDSMERSAQAVRLAIVAAAIVELALFVVAFLMIDWSNRTERLLFVLSVLSYSIIAAGLFALGAHVTRTAGRLLVSLESSGTR